MSGHDILTRETAANYDDQSRAGDPLYELHNL